ncbi:MAG: hypothetical protein EBR82_24510, partial [Caulobacteraceae bacterium]|nr:hypothetical protein [Caulobacteraceae bacterium]
MNGEVTILAKYLGEDVLTNYTVNFATCPDTGSIVCEANKIEISNCTPVLPSEIWQKLADEGVVITVYDGSDAILGTFTINGYDGTGLIYFDPQPFCSTIAESACYFSFQLLAPGTKKQYLDLYPDEVISQNWEFTEVSTFTARAPFSREFRIPLTEVNAEIFNAVQLSNYSGIDFYNKKLEATIFVDDVPVISGFIRLIRSVIQAGVRTDLELSFYGNTPSLFSLIGQKKLKDIVALPGFNGQIDRGDINNPTNPNVTYAMIDRGTNNNLTIAKLTTELAYVTNFTPCITWGWILRNIVLDAGYDLEATDLLTELDTIWMPWINDTPFLLSQQVGGCLIIKETSGTVPLNNNNTRFSTPSNGFVAAIDPLNWWLPNPTGFYPVAGWGPNSVIGTITPGIFDISAWCTFDYPYNTATTITISMVLLPYTTALPVQEFIVSTIQIPANTPGTYFIGGNLSVFLNNGLKLNMSLKSSAGFGGASTVYIEAGDPDQAFIGTGFSVNKRIAPQTDSWIYDYPANAPDATQVQFLQDVINM